MEADKISWSDIMEKHYKKCDNKEEENNDDDNYIVRDCPSCGELIIIFKNEINCKIFRHGIFKDSYKQVPPHSDKLFCDSLSDKNLIYGCGKPFIYDDNDTKLKLCGYI